MVENVKIIDGKKFMWDGIFQLTKSLNLGRLVVSKKVTMVVVVSFFYDLNNLK
jgi:hypothetical protein